MNILITLVVALPGIIQAVDPVNLELFPYAYFQGGSRTYPIQSCSYFSWIGSQVASVKLHDGSCVKLYKSNTCVADSGCNGTVCHLAYPKVQEAILSQEIYHNLYSAQVCSTTKRTALCPNGTWVRRMDFATDSLRSGITIYCYEPGKRTPNVAFNTNVHNLTDFSSQYCKGAARGVGLVRDKSYNLISNAKALCSYSSNVGPDSLQCDKPDALVGITVVVEELSSVIKDIRPICRYVEDPAKLCTPTDNYQPIILCDNTLGFTATSCQYQVTEGVGISLALSEAQSLALNFYGEMGFGAGAGVGDALKVTFAGKLGFSKTTQFDWTQAVATTWNKQTSEQVGISAPPGVITKVEQVIGKCSFYEVDVKYFRRIDTHGNGTSSTLLATTPFEHM